MSLPFITVKRGDFIIPRKFADEVKSFMTAGEKGRFPVKGSSMMVAGLKIPGDFLKTGEFGGRGQGSGTNAEVQAMNYFNDNLNKILKRKCKLRLSILGSLFYFNSLRKLNVVVF